MDCKDKFFYITTTMSCVRDTDKGRCLGANLRIWIITSLLLLAASASFFGIWTASFEEMGSNAGRAATKGDFLIGGILSSAGSLFTFIAALSCSKVPVNCGFSDSGRMDYRRPECVTVHMQCTN